VQHQVHKETARVGFHLSGDTNIIGVEAWENETITRENCDKFDKDTKHLIKNNCRFQQYSFKEILRMVL